MENARTTWRTEIIAGVLAVFILGAGLVGYTKIYNVQSFTCFINGAWDGSPSYQKAREQAQQGDVWNQMSIGNDLVSGVCMPYSAENRRAGLELLLKAAQSDPDAHAGRFYSYARLYRRETPEFLFAAQELLANADIDKDKTDILRLDRVMMECDRGETEWTQCRELMRAETEAGHHRGKWYYAEILARGLGGESDSDRAMQLINSMIEIAAEDLPALGAVSEMNALRTHKQNLFDE